MSDELVRPEIYLFIFIAPFVLHYFMEIGFDDESDGIFQVLYTIILFSSLTIIALNSRKFIYEIIHGGLSIYEAVGILLSVEFFIFSVGLFNILDIRKRRANNRK
ncbi:MAG: hypothetical protein KDI50_03040 [Candidatus Competibacteraceae bacterium]|nr:hypothetical protein [Candidatus Competibacteraceae bacterium]